MVSQPRSDAQPNRLIHETSPYLLQHAYNPVDWYPWGEEALELARRTNKPILLSIGYAACHWCHVMERESFSNPEIARIINEHFVPIKVDREERPDLDALYMLAVQAMTGHGGWPLTVFLTPDLVPFFGGTYFPPEDRAGMPGFPRVLLAVAEYYATQRDDLQERALQMEEILKNAHELRPGPAIPGVQTLERAFQQVRARYDAQHGGFGQAPKFPQPTTLEFLLYVATQQPDSDAREMVFHTLDRMARGGMYDQLGGGFHRYSTDARWFVPHFEKMLYDNAQLATVYLHAYQLSGEPRWATVARETLDYLLREMRDPAGGFYASQDADSEGEEGKFYTWSKAEIDALLGEEAAALCTYYGVRPEGNWEPDRNILFVPYPLEQAAALLGIEPEALAEQIQRGKEKLLAAREERVRPATDDKILSGWNGLVLSALAQAFGVLGDVRYREAAESAADFLLTTMVRDGALFRSYRKEQLRVPGFLEDYAYLAAGLLELFEATQEVRWLTAADALVQEKVRRFWDSANGGFFSTEAAHELPFTRLKEAYNGALPNANAVAAGVLMKRYVLFGRSEDFERVEAILRLFAEPIQEYGGAYPDLTLALAGYHDPPPELVLVAPWGDPAGQQLWARAWRRFLPGRVLAWYDPGTADHPLAGTPLIQGKTMQNGRATAYLCRRFTCQAPTTDPEELDRQLDAY